MRVLFISANTEQINILPLPLGLNCVAVATRDAGHEIRVLDLMAEKKPTESMETTIRTFNPEIIGISVRNIDDQVMTSPKFLLDQAREVITKCRRASNAPIVLGGAGYSIFPESALDYLEADMGIQGEGEVAFPMLLDRISRGLNYSDVPGLYLKGRGLQGNRLFVEDLDTMPLPDACMWSVSASDKREVWVPIQTRRGCPMNCSYCSTGIIEGTSIRLRRQELIIENIKTHVHAGFRLFHFVDNTFNIPLHYAKNICRNIIEHNLNIVWRCICYPGTVDMELVNLMATAGCSEVSLGFESGSESILQSLNKKFSLDSIRRASDMLRDAGIRRMGFLMLGGPGETKATIEQSLAFTDSLDLDMVKITIGIRIYPYTKLAMMAVSEGVISHTDNLLVPRFYVVHELEEWMRKVISNWIGNHSNWIIS